jgi:hypothetical protein
VSAAEWVAVVPTVVAALATIVKGLDLVREPTDRGNQNLVTALACLTMAFILEIPDDQGHRTFLGIDDITRLLGHALALIATCGTLVLLEGWSLGFDAARDVIRRQWTLLCAVLAALTVLFFVDPTRGEPENLIDPYANAHPALIAYGLLLYAYIGYAMAGILRGSLSSARLQSGLTAFGQRLCSVTGVFGMVAAANKLAWIFNTIASDPLSWPYVIIGNSLEGLATISMFIGLGLPSIDERLAGRKTRRQERAARATLAPLWQDLLALFPEIQLPEADLHDVYRPLMEISDGLLALRPYIDATVRDAATAVALEHDVAAEDLDAVVTAAQIAVAVDAARAGRFPASETRPVATVAVPEPGAGHAGGIQEQLVPIAAAYSRSPVVAAVRAAHAARPINTEESHHGR